MNIERELVDSFGFLLPIKTFFTDSSTIDPGSAPHIHDENEVVLLLEGEMEFTIENKTVVLTSGHVLFIKGLVTHSSRLTTGIRTQICVLQYSNDFLYSSNIGEIRYFSNFVQADTLKFFVFDKDKSSTAEIKNLLLNTEKEFEEKNLAYEMVIKSNLYRFVSILFREGILQSSSKFDDMEGCSIDRISEVLKYIERHYDQPITIEEASKLLNVNYSYFCKLFKQATGQSFIQYLNYYRVVVAKQLLVDSSKNITEVMLESGFSSLSYFDRVFKRFCGCTATKFRTKFTAPEP